MIKKDWWLRFSIIFFSLFVLNVVVGKVLIVLNLERTYLLGDVPDFLVLFLAVIFFVNGFLRREKIKSQSL